jgi:hypothetical protein
MCSQFCPIDPPCDLGLSAPRIRRLSDSQSVSEQQFFPRWVLDFEVSRSQGSEMFQEGRSHAKANKLGFDGRKNGIVAARSRPLLQDGELFWLVLQVLKYPGKQDAYEVVKGNSFLDVPDISGLPKSAISSVVSNRLMKRPPSFVSAEVVCEASHDLFHMSQEAFVAFEVLGIDRATLSWRVGSGLYSHDGAIDDFLAARARQVSCQSLVDPQLSQQTLSQPGELPPLLVGNCGERTVYIDIGPVWLLLLPRFGSFRFHFEKRVWRNFRNELPL